ncbi:hypothetical protein VTP01DRAFT_8955 [Rhizomucor pusillus]|uniref:uncharacterized protein n=1 Tax=Rhizomucor pusillus TaxID=4840 RepID=UPI0037435F8C
MHTYDEHERQKGATWLLISDKTTVYIDFCCDFFRLLQEYAVGFLRVTSSRREALQQQDHYTDIVRIFVLREMDKLNAFANQSGVTKICLVFDGARLQAKKSLAFKKAQRPNEELNRSFNALKHRLREKYARQWVSFTPAIKHAIIQQLDARRDPRRYTCDFADEDATIFIHEAPFEADPEIVYLCNSIRSAIMSRDGDLFAYQGALDVPRITKMNWREGPQRHHGTVSTKRSLLTAFMGLQARITDDQAINAEIRFVVLAVTCGNDYARNLRG